MTLPQANGSPVPRRGTRNILSKRILEDIAEAWHEHGATSLTILAKEDPGKFAQLGVAILPRDVLVSVEGAVPGGLDPQDWALMLRVLDLVKAAIPAEAEPGEVFQVIEHALRERYAKIVSE